MTNPEHNSCRTKTPCDKSRTDIFCCGLQNGRKIHLTVNLHVPRILHTSANSRMTMEEVIILVTALETAEVARGQNTQQFHKQPSAFHNR